MNIFFVFYLYLSKTKRQRQKMENYISVQINKQNHNFYKHISTNSFGNKNIILQIIYANHHIYYAIPYAIHSYGINGSAWTIYAKSFYNKINNDFWSMEYFYFPRDQIKLLIQIPNYVHTIKNLSIAKQIIPLLKKIPYDLHKTIYSYF